MLQPTLEIQSDKRLESKQITPEILNYITEKIVHEISPIKIIMFGSRARGEEKESSDLDLFIIQDGKTSNRKLRRRIERLLWGREFSLDLIVVTPKEVEANVADNNPFYTKHVLKEGKVLYERRG